MHILISSNENAHVKEAIHLSERRYRNKTGLFLIEGYRELLRAVDAGVEIDRLFICPELFLGTNEQALIDSIKAKTFSCTDKIFSKMSYRDRPDGLLAIAKQHSPTLADLKTILEKVKNPLIVVCEAIEKPGNLGTILRSADAAGVSAVIVANQCTDIFNPNVVRASTGILFSMPVVLATSQETIDFLHSEKMQILAARPQATVRYTDIDMTGPTAIAVGTEQLGLSSLWNLGLQVRIPMYGKADSLNVAQATTLLLYEAARQRHPL